MSRFVSDKALRRFAAAAIGLFVIGTIASPGGSPARGSGSTNVAVNTFSNDAGAAPKVVSDLSNAAYRAVAASGKFNAKGGGPLPYEKSLTNDPFVDGLQAAARAGAEEVLFGGVISVSGGQVYYRLSLYRVAPVTFIGSQVFSQAYPAGDQSVAAGIAANIATLTAPRQAMGTIYSTTTGVMADTGTEGGFVLGDRFNVMRDGKKVAEATITSIRPDDAVLTISNAAPGYAPATGDSLVGLRALGPVPPAVAQHSTFNVFALLAAAGGALLAIGHHGQPGTPCSGCVAPSPSVSPFIITGFSSNGHPPTGFFTFIFSEPVSSSSENSIKGDTNFAYFVIKPQGSQATTQPAPLQQLGAVAFDQTGTQLTVPEQNGVVQGDQIDFFFTNLITSTTGASLVPETTGLQTLSKILHPFTTKMQGSGPGPVPPGPKPPSGGQPVPKGPHPKPPPGDPHVPH